MKTKRTSTVAIADRARPRVRTLASYTLFGMLFLILVASALYTASSASSNNKVADAARSARTVTYNEGVTGAHSRSLSTRWLDPLSPLPPLAPDTLATYEVVGGLCTNTLKDTFSVGDGDTRPPDQVCVRASADLFGRRLSIAGTDGTVADVVDITTDPQELIFTLPDSTTSVVNGLVVDNRGIWRATIHSSADFGSRATTFFNVTDPDNAAADLVIFSDSTATAPVTPGNPTGFSVYLRNDGPDAAAAVHVTQNVPANMTFDSATAGSGTSFTCSENAGVVDCAPAGNLPSGATSAFTLNYDVSAGAPTAILTTEIDIDSTTTDPHPTSNTSTSKVEIRAAGDTGSTCALACPLNLTVAANTTQGGQDGAIVNFAGDIESTGDCGTVTSSPASGSFFALGTTTVNVSSATGGGTCSFTITVTQTAAPTITCAADQTATTSGNSNEASVTINTPSATGNNVQVTGVRNDNRSLSDGYPVGTTTITWTARECNNPPDCDDPNARSASCTQRIIVTSSDVPTITCPSNKSYPAADCEGRTLTAAEIGSPTATGSNVQITSRRSDDLHLTNDPYPVGTTVITWSATDDAGRVASCTQSITITSSGADNVPPTLHVPPDVSATTDSCTATLDDELGVATAEDNCGTTTISRSGVPTFACPTPSDPNRRCESFVFPTGTTIITYTATDSAGNSTTGTQRVTVTESPAVNPTITAPADVSVNTGAGATSCGAVVDDAALGNASANDNCPGVTVSRTGVPAGNNFPVGNTTVTYTATDASGNTATDTQIVTVVDNTVPTITAPADSSDNADANCQAPVPDYRPNTTAADNCGSVTLTQSPAPGTLVGFGPHTVTITATDSHNNTNSDDVVFTVNDVTPPTITAPADSSAFADSVCLSPVPDYRPGTVAADNCGSVTLSQTPAPGTLVGYGPHTITVTANDGHGNTNSDTVVFTVNDNTPPVFTSCPTSSTIEPTCPTGAIQTYATPTATDNCGATVTRTAGPASGSVFPIGTTTVTHVADDGHGNTATCTFTVKVLTPQAVIQNLINSVNASSLTGTQKNGLVAKLNAALTAINGGGGNACAKLSDFVNSVGTLISHGDISAAQGNAWISSANHVRNTIGCTNLGCS
jgi:hypothetical protein